MYNENTSHLDIIVEDGTVKIPSIFMFKTSRDITQFLDKSEEMNCTVIFENENIKVFPNTDNGIVCAILAIYKQMVDNHEIGNAYVRYLGIIDKMKWENMV